MKLFFFASLAIHLIGNGATYSQEIYLSRLVLTAGQKYTIKNVDSNVHLRIDTLIMKNRSKLIAFGKKNLVLTIKHAIIEDKCVISGSDGHNNGTNIDLRINIIALGSLYINARGLNFREGNPNYIIGKGGNISIHYLGTGLTPQLNRPHQNRYIGINNKGGQGSINPVSDMYVIKSQIADGNLIQGRPLSMLPNGTIFQGSDGLAGKSSVIEVKNL